MNGPANRRALILANPICLGRHGLAPEDLIAALAEGGLQAEVALMSVDPDLDAWRERVREGPYDRLVAAGGDGTVHHVVNLAVPLGLPVGVFPLGTANDFARTLRLEPGVAAAARLVAEGATLPLDLGRVNGRYFVNAAHLGLGVETARLTRPWLKRLIGPLAYAVAALEAVARHAPTPIEACTAESCVKLNASQILVGNGRFFGGGVLVAPEATLSDGLLDVYVMPGRPRPGDMLKLFTAVRTGTLDRVAGLRHERTRHLTVRMARSVQVNADGELLGLKSPLHFEVLPGALRVFAPGPARVPGPAREDQAVERMG